MYQISDYARFSIADVEKFERRIRKWCREEYVPKKSIIVFDKNSLLVKGKLEIVVKGEKNFYKIFLPNITLEYILISGSMCIMTKILENKSQRLLYDLPESWKNSQLWYAF